MADQDLSFRLAMPISARQIALTVLMFLAHGLIDCEVQARTSLFTAQARVSGHYTHPIPSFQSIRTLSIPS